MAETSPRKVIITGATDGIGLRLAWLFAERGDELLLTGRKDAKRFYLSRFLKRRVILRRINRTPIALPSSKSMSLKMGWSRIDNLVLNAATGLATDAASEIPEQIITTMQVNMEAPIIVVHQLSEFLIAADAPRSTVTFIGSTARKGASGFASYAASKAGLSGFVRALASEWRDLADVQILHPGPTKTDMQKKAGMEVGAIGKYFVDADYSARQIFKLINSGKSQANIGMAGYGFHGIKQKLGLAPKLENIMPS